jgi:hypothetical protein
MPVHESRGGPDRVTEGVAAVSRRQARPLAVWGLPAPASHEPDVIATRHDRPGGRRADHRTKRPSNRRDRAASSGVLSGELDEIDDVPLAVGEPGGFGAGVATPSTVFGPLSMVYSSN